MKKECKFEGCTNMHFAKGYCNKHYRLFKKYGYIPERSQKDPNEIIQYDDYAEILLYNRQGQEIARTTVDLDDVNILKVYKWHLDVDGYVVNHKIGRLHRFLLKPLKELVVDHINRNPLDNRRSNLRICTVQENSMNRSIQCNNTSGTSGVYWLATYNKWVARIKLNGNWKHLGYFDVKEDAVKARRQAEIKYFREYAPNDESNL